MKILLICFLFLSSLNADEMSRIDAIVSDITKLRVNYNQCKKELALKSDSSVNINLLKRIDKLERIIIRLKNKPKTKKNNDGFPQLIMKEKFTKNDKVTNFKAASFYLKYESIIYNGIDGDMIDKWERLTSFTSSVKTKSWIKITGYFINKKWIPAKKDMWVKIKQVEKK